jgi:large subunit ribosomal protein L22
MEVRARLSYFRASPRKVKALADLIKGKGVSDALAILKFMRKGSSGPLHKLLTSAVANAALKDKKIDADSLVVKSVVVEAGPTMKRFMTRSMGRANRILKRTSHVTVVLEDR